MRLMEYVRDALDALQFIREGKGVGANLESICPQSGTASHADFGFDTRLNILLWRERGRQPACLSVC